jgi:hypothetical protein
MDRSALPVSLAIGAIALAGCGSSTSAPTTSNNNNGLALLSGKRLPGAPSSWTPIGSPLSHPVNVAGTITPPVETGEIAGGGPVSFFEFGSVAGATAFYKGPPLDAREVAISPGILQYRPLAGPTGVPQPSRGLDLRSCLWSYSGPGHGTPSSGTMNAAGSCSEGASSSIGVATIVQRGKIVVISQAIGGADVIGGPAHRAELTSFAVGVARYALSALTLMQQVGVK